MGALLEVPSLDDLSGIGVVVQPSDQEFGCD